MHRLRILILLVYGVTSSAVIHEAAAQSKSVQHTLAKKHFELGQQYYQTADYTKALEEFNQAYRLKPLPELAFNMGRCYEALNDLEQALKYFRLYLDKKPGTPDRAVLEQRIKNIEKRLAQQQLKQRAQQEQADATRRAAVSAAAERTRAASKTEEQAAPTPAVVDDPAPVDQPQPAKRAWRVPVGWTLVGVGAASLVTGIVFGSMVSSKNSEYDDAVKGKTYDEQQAIKGELQDIQDSADQLQTLQVVTLVAGGVLAAAGGGLLIWHWADNRQRGTAAVSLFPFVTHQTAGLGFNARF